MEIYIAKSGHETGPFTWEQVQPMLDSGMISLTDSLWHEELPDWIPVHRFLNVRPPPPPEDPQSKPGLPEISPFAPPAPAAIQADPRIVAPASHSGELASFGRRMGAAIIDSVIWLFVTSLTAGLLLEFLFEEKLGLVSALSTNRIAWITGVVVGWLYSAGMECSAAKGTLGKIAFGLVVNDKKGGKLDFFDTSARYVGKWLVPATVGLSFLPCAWTEWKQALHDLICGAVVVRK